MNPYLKKFQYGGKGDPEDPYESWVSQMFNFSNNSTPVITQTSNPATGGYSWGSGYTQPAVTQLAPINKEYAVGTTVPSKPIPIELTDIQKEQIAIRKQQQEKEAQRQQFLAQRNEANKYIPGKGKTNAVGLYGVPDPNTMRVLAMNQAATQAAEFTGIPGAVRFLSDPINKLQDLGSAAETFIMDSNSMPSSTMQQIKPMDYKPEGIQAFSDVLDFAGLASLGTGTILKNAPKSFFSFKPSYMSLDAPKGNMFGQNQVLTQQARLLNPDIKNKFFKNQAKPFTGNVTKFSKQPNDYLNRITQNNYEDFVTDVHSKTDYAPAASVHKRPGNLGSGNYGRSGIVYTDAPLNNLGKDVINAHEKNHGIFAGTLSEKMTDDLLRPFETRRPIPNYKDKNQADEVLARMAQFKNAFGMGNNQVFTLGHLNWIRKNYANTFVDNGITDMLSLIKPGSKSEKLFLKNMNKYAFGSLPIISGGAAASIGVNQIMQPISENRKGGKVNPFLK